MRRSGYECRRFYLYLCYYGGRIFWGILLGYALKKVFKLIAVVVGLFIGGLAYLQYQHITFFDWNRIEEIATTILGNITNQVASNQDVAALGMSTLGIPLTGSMSAGFAIGLMKG
jgi:uncharacterized membrane protein (Fun14 family)